MIITWSYPVSNDMIPNKDLMLDSDYAFNRYPSCMSRVESNQRVLRMKRMLCSPPITSPLHVISI